MWKKLLAAVMLVGVISTSTAFAVDPKQPGGNIPSDGTVLSNFKVAPDKFTINPTKNEVFDVTFDLTQDADILSYVIAVPSDQVVATFADTAATKKGAIKFTWTGKQNNQANTNVMPDGTYTIKTFAINAQKAVIDSRLQNVTISTVNQLAPKISNLKADPATFSPATGEDTDLYFDVDKNGFLTVEVIQNNNVVSKFSAFTNGYYDAGSQVINWNGTDTTGTTIVPDGVYQVKVTATNDSGTNTATTNVTVATGVPATGGSVKNLSLDPASSWNPTKGDVEISYKLTNDVKSLTILAKQGNKVVKVLDDKDVDDGFYTEIWDGTDDDGDYVDTGSWEISVIADGVTVKKNVTVKFDQPAIVEAFVTKSSFDPSKNEAQNFVFKIDTKSEVDVTVFQGTQKETTLVTDQLVEKNKWYTVTWDGRDSDGAEVDFGGDWKFKINAKNPTAQDLLANKTVNFKVENDGVSEKKSNITNDTTYPVVFDDAMVSEISLDYSIDQDAQVFIAVYEGNSTGGKAKITLLDYVAQEAGYHTVSWNGRDENNKVLKDGEYTYKIISKSNGSNKETEIGTFVVGNAGEYITELPPIVEPPVLAQCEDGVDNDFDGYTDLMDAGCDSASDEDEYNYVEPPLPPVVDDCGGYMDTKFIVKQNYDTCAAIDWVTEAGIFSGYADGTFGPNNPISRSEVLKVVLKSFQNATILPSDGSNQGFWDADASAWYMPYVRTAKFYGMLQGYADGSAGIAKQVSRAEFLKFALKASAAFTGYQVPAYSFSYYSDVAMNAWYKDFAGVAYELSFFGYNYPSSGTASYLFPDKAITRGEVATILYRMYNSSLLDSYPTYYGY